MKKALMTGITGQDGSYLAELLLSKDYEMHALFAALCHSTLSVLTISTRIHTSMACNCFSNGDIADSTHLIKLLYRIQPDEIYHLAAQSSCSREFRHPLE